MSIEPHRLLGKKTVQLNDLTNRSLAGVKEALHRGELELSGKENRLGGLNPKAVLKRGYSITTNKRTGKLTRRADDVNIGDLLVTELAEKNLIESEVKSKQNKKKGG